MSVPDRSSLDRGQDNRRIDIFSSAARTADATSARVENFGHVGVVLIINVSAAADTPSVTFTIRGHDALSVMPWTILTSAAITGTGQTILRVHHGLTAATNTIAEDVMPREWEVFANHADTDSITYSVAAYPIVR